MLDALREFLVHVSRVVRGLLWSVDYQEALFLPPGKGPAILILGGVSMLVLALCLSLQAPRTRPGSASPPATGARGRAAGSTSRTPTGSGRDPLAGHAGRPPQVQAVLEASRAAGLGLPRRVSARPDRHRIAFRSCPGRRSGCAGERACKRVLRVLERGLEARGTGGHVVRVRCNAGRAGACLYEVRTGERPP